jgi:hypothetical protein
VLELKILRNEWDSQDEGEAYLFEASTIQERLDQWVGIQTAFEWQLQQTATLFGQDRWSALVELQARLQHLSNP